MAGPVALGINGSFNIGQDASVVLQHLESGVILPAALLGHLMEFDMQQQDRVLEVIPITDGGRPSFNTVYMGWSGHMAFTRENGNLDGIMSALESNFYNYRILSHFSITLTVLNRDGTTDQYLFKNAVLNRGQAGNYRADKEVDQRIDFRAESRVVTSGIGTLIATL